MNAQQIKYQWNVLSCGTPIDCELEYLPAQGDGWHEPVTPECMTLYIANLNGVDIYEILSILQVAEIEFLALECARDCFVASKEQAAEARADHARDMAEAAQVSS